MFQFLQPVYAPSAISARGGKFRFLPGTPGYVTVSKTGSIYVRASTKIAYIQPTAVEDPWTIVEQYKKAAINAKEAGFDGVESKFLHDYRLENVFELMHNRLVHGANGYLVTQFLDSTANHRTDQWGGSVENRSRFGLEVLKAVKEVFGRNISIKLSPAGGYNDVGYVTGHSLFDSSS